MSNSPTIYDFICRVGGLFLVYLLAILAMKLWFTGYESVAVFTVTGLVFATLIYNEITRKIKVRHKQKKQRG